jgi:hypothetical protein
VFRYLKRIVAGSGRDSDVLERTSSAHGSGYNPRRTAYHNSVRARRTNTRVVEIALPDRTAASRRPEAPHHVAVLLNQERVFAHPGEGYEPLSGHVKAIEFDVDAVSPAGACEVAYAVTNSYPAELHCERKYLDVVRTYREIGHFRSVTVGDIFVVNDEWFFCAHFGFPKLLG